MEVRELVDLIYDERKNYYVVVGRCGNKLKLRNAFLHWANCDLIDVKNGKATINDGKIEIRKAIDVLKYRAELFGKTDTRQFFLSDIIKEYEVEFTTEYTK